MRRAFHPSSNENGFVLVLSMWIMVVLIVIGISTIRGSKTDIQIAGNERWHKNRFYIADSAWPDGANWLNGKASAPSRVNLTAGVKGSGWNSIKNFGSGEDGATKIVEDDTDGNLNTISYWYKIDQEGDRKPIGFGDDYRDFIYDIEANADQASTIEVRVNKVFKVGYN